jgi:hypothetical protein
MLLGNQSDAGRAYGTNPLSGFSAGAGEYPKVVSAYTGVIGCWQIKNVTATRSSEIRMRHKVIVRKRLGSWFSWDLFEAMRWAKYYFD